MLGLANDGMWGFDFTFNEAPVRNQKALNLSEPETLSMRNAQVLGNGRV